MAQTSEESEWQPVRIAAAKDIAIAHGYWPPLKTWEEMQGKIILVKRQEKGTAWWDTRYIPNPVPQSNCNGEEFRIRNQDQFIDEGGLPIGSVCEHQILDD